MTRTRHALAASIAATALVASAACTGDHKSSSSSSPAPSTPSSSSSKTTKPKPKPKPKPAKNPFTGIGRVPKSPTIAVKIDDTDSGRPQRGIDRADIVYIEAVEGGLTRLAAIFGTYKPVVGYVRSTRPSDPDLLLQYGKITEAYSGGAHDSLPRVHRSGITSWSNDAGAPYYFRASHPNDHGYVNLVLNLHKVAKRVHTPRPRNIGWTFNTKLAGLHLRAGRAVHTTVTGSYNNGTAVDFKYSPRLKRYVRYINGVPQRAADGKLVTAKNVVVQACKIVPHFQDRDVLGNPAQFTFTVGKGRVSVFRGGKRINGYWSRQHLNSGTSLRSRGRAIPLAPGNTWVVLIKKGIAVNG